MLGPEDAIPGCRRALCGIFAAIHRAAKKIAYLHSFRFDTAVSARLYTAPTPLAGEILRAAFRLKRKRFFGLDGRCLTL